MKSLPYTTSNRWCRLVIISIYVCISKTSHIKVGISFSVSKLFLSLWTLLLTCCSSRFCYELWARGTRKITVSLQRKWNRMLYISQFIRHLWMFLIQLSWNYISDSWISRSKICPVNLLSEYLKPISDLKWYINKQIK